jgi:hypothetical protein
VFIDTNHQRIAAPAITAPPIDQQRTRHRSISIRAILRLTVVAWASSAVGDDSHPL